MSSARLAVTSVAVLAVVDVFHTVVAWGEYERRISVVTHDGSWPAGLVDYVVPLRELSPMTTGLVLFLLALAVAAVVNWVVQARRAGAPLARLARPLVAVSAAASLSLASAAQIRFAGAQGGEYMRTVRAETYWLLTGTVLALVIATIVTRRAAERTDQAGRSIGAASP